MSHLLIQRYLNEMQDLRKVSGTTRESVVREAFKDLLKGWARSHDHVFVPEYAIETPAMDFRKAWSHSRPACPPGVVFTPTRWPDGAVHFFAVPVSP